MLKKRVIVAMLLVVCISTVAWVAWAGEGQPAPPTPPPPEVIAANLLKGPNLGGSTLEVEFEYTTLESNFWKNNESYEKCRMVYRDSSAMRLDIHPNGSLPVYTWLYGQNLAMYFGGQHVLTESVLPVPDYAIPDGASLSQLKSQERQTRIWADLLGITHQPLDLQLENGSVSLTDHKVTFDAMQAETSFGPQMSKITGSFNQSLSRWVIDRIADNHGVRIFSDYIAISGNKGIVPGQIVSLSNMHPERVTLWKIRNVRVVPDAEAIELLKIPDSVFHDTASGTSVIGVIRYEADGTETKHSF